MNIHSLTIPLNTSSEQVARLEQLQQVFADICNALAPVVRETKCWNRVALHHMMYRPLRDQFPQVGSQMVCNAIYSVSRTSRVVYQSAQSPFNLQRLAEKPLPLLRFLSSAPVYFDRHTLSVKKGSLSMYTLDGRMRFDLHLSDDDLNRFKTWKLHEVILSSVSSQFTLNFSFVDGKAISTESLNDSSTGLMPEYVLIDEDSTPFSHSSSLTNLHSKSQLDSKDVAPLASHTTPIAPPTQESSFQLGLNSQSNDLSSLVQIMPGGLNLSVSSKSLQLNIKSRSQKQVVELNGSIGIKPEVQAMDETLKQNTQNTTGANT